MTKQSADAGEGRADLARPSLCLLLAIAALSSAAPSAQAAQPEILVLTNTTPPSSASSPANSTTPLVRGGEDGSIITAVGLGPEAGNPIAAAGDPGNEVEIYTSFDCTGTPVATGTLGQLEKVGIQVEVPPDSTTTFYARQAEVGEPVPSDCSISGLTYWESSTAVTPPDGEPPGGGGPGEGGPGGGAPGGEPGVSGNAAIPPAPRLRTIPGHRANDNAPLLAGDASGAGAVRIFANSNCDGAPVASGSAAELAAGLRVQVADNTATVFSGVSVAAGSRSPCSASVTYVEDSTAPRTRFTMGPGAKTRKHKAVFRFADITDDPPGTTFLCKVNHRKWKQCNSPLKLRHLRVDRYVVRVKATDSAGNAEAKGAKRRFKVIPSS